MTVTHEIIISLTLLPGCGPATVEKICTNLQKLPQESLTSAELIRLLGALKDSNSLPRFNVPDRETLEECILKARRIISRSEELGIGIVSKYDSDYPDRLRSTVDEKGKASAPVILYYRGDLSAASLPAVAIIGTRAPSPEGEKAALYLGGAFARLGCNIVSGLAIGCDTCGHRGALAAGGITTAFLAGGLDRIYPEENASLAESIVENGGLLMSEYPAGTPSNRYNLVARDRLQAGLADAIVVVQTTVTGGTMHAANAAAAAGKPLYAVEYSTNVTPAKIAGNRFLVLEKGARALAGNADLSRIVDSFASGMQAEGGAEPTLF